MKKLTLLFLLLISGNVLSADFCEDFVGYRDMIRQKMNLAITNTTAISDTTLNQFIRESIIKVVPIIKAYKSIDSFVTGNRQGVYSLDSTVVSVLNVEWSKNDSLKTMLYMPKELWFQQKLKPVAERTSYDRRPSYYDYIDNLLFLYPISTKSGDTIKVMVTRKIANIDSSIVDLSLIPQKYRIAVLSYATYLSARSIQNPLANSFRFDFKEEVALLETRGSNVSTPTK